MCQRKARVGKTHWLSSQFCLSRPWNWWTLIATTLPQGLKKQKQIEKCIFFFTMFRKNTTVSELYLERTLRHLAPPVTQLVPKLYSLLFSSSWKITSWKVVLQHFSTFHMDNYFLTDTTLQNPFYDPQDKFKAFCLILQPRLESGVEKSHISKYSMILYGLKSPNLEYYRAPRRA